MEKIERRITDGSKEHKLNFNLLTGRKTGIMVDSRRTVLGRLERVRHEKSKGQYRFVFKNGISLVISQEILYFHTLLKKDGDCIFLEFSREEILSGIVAYSLYGTYGLPLEFTLDEAELMNLPVDVTGFNILKEIQQNRDKGSFRNTDAF